MKKNGCCISWYTDTLKLGAFPSLQFGKFANIPPVCLEYLLVTGRCRLLSGCAAAGPTAPAPGRDLSEPPLLNKIPSYCHSERYAFVHPWYHVICSWRTFRRHVHLVSVWTLSPLFNSLYSQIKKGVKKSRLKTSPVSKAQWVKSNAISMSESSILLTLRLLARLDITRTYSYNWSLPSYLHAVLSYFTSALFLYPMTQQ